MIRHVEPAVRVDFFISYTSADLPWAEWIAQVLEAAGYSVLVQAWDFRPGANFVLEMDRAVRISDRTVAVLSPAFLESPFAAAEWAGAFKKDPTGSGRKLLPVRVRECDPEGLLGSVVFVDVFGVGEDAAHERLLSAARGERGKPSVVPTFPEREAVSRPVAGAAIWNVPHVSSRFVGRESLLSDLAERLTDADAAAPTQVEALHGLGGVGKTRVAIEYAHRYRERYDVVWWVRAENPLTLLGDYAGLADALALPDHMERAQDARAAAVRAWLESHPRWLLVFDNAPSPASISGVLPQGRNGHVVIASRQHGGWRGTADPVTIGVWSRKESLGFLSQRTGDSDATAAEAVAEALGDLPLALEQAAAYVDSTQISLAGYLSRLESKAPALFQRGSPSGYEHTIATTWELAFAQLEQDPGCAALLFCCAFFAPERIPRELFLSRAVADGVFIGDDGELALDDAISRILAFSLLIADETTLSMHRLVQHVIRNRLNDHRDQWLGTAQRLLVEEFPENGNDPRTWPTCERLLPHAGISGSAPQIASAETAVLLARVGRYLGGRGEYRVAVEVLERALEAARQVYGRQHPETLSYGNNLAGAYRAAGRLGEAILLLEETLSASVRILGPEHVDTLTFRNNLGTAYDTAGRFAEAIPLFEETLGARVRILGPEHPDTLVTRNNLASAYQAVRRFADAIPPLEETLGARLRILGPEHPDTLTTCNNLAGAYQAAGRLSEATLLYEETLAARERIVGAEHPDTLTSRNNLASAYLAAGRLAEAILLSEETLGARERVLGAEHLDTLTSCNNLAYAYRVAGQPDRAVALYAEALGRAEDTLGGDHPTTKTLRANLESARLEAAAR